ncbi:YceI family protein [Marinicella sp. S1101]|uniref:YceI family protein n=1 Tax=Marinicella marina TaxID=2996016 RepID=UPI002260C150|nr:YceI family protein [Marinicella marina]MCX7553419.1 YceI family protein [Marinicella marina]MDJ1140043.1 YceI family protein [Marinicella marina]
MKQITESIKNLTLILSLFAVVACQKQSNKTAVDKAFMGHQWQLVTDSSTLTFISTKNKTITEEHKLQFGQGSIDSNSDMVLAVDLESVDTMIPIRDERMRNILFKTDQYPSATVSASIPTGIELNQKVELPFTLNLHGQTRTMKAQVMAQMVEGRLVVVNYEPIAINTKDFGMDDGINKLTQIAGLLSIDYASLVDFKLTFEK